jgi:hypothetical protein
MTPKCVQWRRLASLNGEIFYTLRVAQVVIEQWRHHYRHPTAQRAELSAARTGAVLIHRPQPAACGTPRKLTWHLGQSMQASQASADSWLWHCIYVEG